MRTRRDYRIGWICALPLELAAAQAMLDTIHDPLPNATGDRNAYLLGNIGPHNLVITCLPSGVYGTNSASATATQMRFSYEAIQCCLLVGIGEGVPFQAEQDIRLGDIVVSEPTMQSGGVIQYDYGKALDKGQFLPTGTLDEPPEVLLRALARLKSQHMLHGSNVHLLYDEVLNKYPRLRQEFSYPGAEHDQLFVADYSHEGYAENCDQCNPAMLRPRFNRVSSEPQIFYGLIASANKVVRDAKLRDQLAQRHDIFCFEMEAAGVMNTFPSLVIRGMCDYSDSHKNKRWQGYAAMVAAAYTKGLIHLLPSHDLADTSKVRESQTSHLDPPSQARDSYPPLSEPVHGGSFDTSTNKESLGRSATLRLLERYRSYLYDWKYRDDVKTITHALGSLKPQEDQKRIFKANLSTARSRKTWHPWPEDCFGVFNALKKWLQPTNQPVLLLYSPGDHHRIQDLAVEVVDYLRQAERGKRIDCPGYQIFWSLRATGTKTSGNNDGRIRGLIKQLVEADPEHFFGSAVGYYRRLLMSFHGVDKVWQLLSMILVNYRKNVFIILEGTEFLRDGWLFLLVAHLDMGRHYGLSHVKILVLCGIEYTELQALQSRGIIKIQIPEPPPPLPPQLMSHWPRRKECAWDLLIPDLFIPDFKQLAKSGDDEISRGAV